MRTSISTAGLASANASQTDEVWLAMAVLTHADWVQPIRLVRNSEDITSNGELFQAFPFDITLPDSDPDALAVVEWVAANSSQELLALFRGVSGKIGGSVFWILASNPDYIEVGPFDLEMPGFEYDDLTLKGSLAIEPVLGAVYGSKSMDSAHAPGLF